MEIHSADPRAKRTAVILLLAGLIAGATVILLLDRSRPEIARWILADKQQAVFRARLVLGFVALIVVAPLIGFAAYFHRLGSATVRSGRFPPPGTAMLHDTPVVSGQAAHTRGRVIQAIGAMFVALAIAIAALLWSLASRAASIG
jgi:hypothetical protein